MSAVHVRTDNKWKNFVYGHDVPKKAKKDFDHLDDDESSDGFFCYLGRWYHISDFMVTPKDFNCEMPWDGYHSDSFFSGVVLKVAKDGERYQVGTYII